MSADREKRKPTISDRLRFMPPGLRSLDAINRALSALRAMEAPPQSLQSQIPIPPYKPDVPSPRIEHGPFQEAFDAGGLPEWLQASLAPAPAPAPAPSVERPFAFPAPPVFDSQGTLAALEQAANIPIPQYRQPVLPVKPEPQPPNPWALGLGALAGMQNPMLGAGGLSSAIGSQLASNRIEEDRWREDVQRLQDEALKMYDLDRRMYADQADSLNARFNALSRQEAANYSGQVRAYVAQVGAQARLLQEEMKQGGSAAERARKSAESLQKVLLEAAFDPQLGQAERASIAGMIEGLEQIKTAPSVPEISAGLKKEWQDAWYESRNRQLNIQARLADLARDKETFDQWAVKNKLSLDKDKFAYAKKVASGGAKLSEQAKWMAKNEFDEARRLQENADNIRSEISFKTLGAIKAEGIDVEAARREMNRLEREAYAKREQAMRWLGASNPGMDDETKLDFSRAFQDAISGILGNSSLGDGELLPLGFPSDGSFGLRLPPSPSNNIVLPKPPPAKRSSGQNGVDKAFKDFAGK